MAKSVVIQLKRDLEEVWDRHSDKILHKAELVVVQGQDEDGNETVKFKLGDGKTPYKDLPFVPLIDGINDGYIYVGQPIKMAGKITIALKDRKEDTKMPILTKRQVFDLKFKYLDMTPVDGSGKKIENWWENAIAWINVSMNKTISLDFAKEFKDHLVWETLCYYNTLSEEIMREFPDKLNWKTISSKQKLSENFIRDFKNKLDWNCIPYHQNLSKEFEEEMMREGYIK